MGMPIINSGRLKGFYLPDYPKGSIINLLSSVIRSRGGRSPHRELAGLRQRLLQACHRDAWAQPAFAGIQRLLACQHFEQGGLAGTVAAQQAKLVAAGDTELHLVEQYMGAVVEAGLVEA